MLVHVGRLAARGVANVATPSWVLRDENGDAALLHVEPGRYWFDGQAYADFASWSAAVATLTVAVDNRGTLRDASGARVQAATNVLRLDHDADGAQIGWLFEGASDNCFRNSSAPVTQMITDSFSNRTNIWMEGSGSITVTGPESATVTEGNPLYYDLSGHPTLTLSGEVKLVQVEQGNSNRIPSSYIPATNAAVGRNADVFNFGPNGASLPFAGFAADAGTLVIHGRSARYFNAVDQTAFQLDDGTGNNVIKVYCSEGTNLAIDVKSAGADQAALSFTDFSLGRDFAAAIAFGANDFALSVDGCAEIWDTSGSVPSVSTLRMGSNGGGDAWMGHVGLIAYFPRRVAALPSRQFFRPFPSRVHALGDSFVSAGFVSALKTDLGGTIMTFDGVGGSTLAEQLTRWRATPAFHDRILIMTDDMAPFTDSPSDIATFMATYASILALLTSRKFLIMEPGMPIGGVGGTSSHEERDNKWNAIVAAYPENVVPVTAAMQAAGDGSDLDKAYIAANLWPASCLNDPGSSPTTTVDGHLNAKGNGIYAQCAFNALRAKGWV